MTAVLGRKGDREPIVCGACGRYSDGYGVTTKSGPICWTCGETTCLKAAKRIIYMSEKELNRIECVAIAEAGRDCFKELFGAFLDGMWNKGVRSLEQMTPDMVEAAQVEIVNAPEFQRALAAFLRMFGQSIERQVINGDAPF